MKCEKCLEEWKIQDLGDRFVKFCPFCGAEYKEKEPDGFSTLVECFKYLRRKFTYTIFFEPKKILSYVSDYMPKLMVEKRILKVTLEAGIYRQLLDDAGNIVELNIEKAKFTLVNDYGLSEKWAWEAVDWLVKAFGTVQFGRFDHGSKPEVIVSDNPQSILSVPISTHIQNNTMTVSSMDHVPDSRWSRDKSWESVTKIVLGPGITEIKMEAFRGLKDLREVVLPEGLKKIGFSAFADCIKLDNVVIPEGTTTIAAHAFEKCNKLANITIPKSVKYIGDDAFNATAIKSATVQKDCVICRGNYPIKASAE